MMLSSRSILSMGRLSLRAVASARRLPPARMGEEWPVGTSVQGDGEGRAPRATARRLTRAYGLLALPVLVHLAGSWHRRWMQEDGFINIRIVQQLLAGN